MFINFKNNKTNKESAFYDLEKAELQSMLLSITEKVKEYDLRIEPLDAFNVCDDVFQNSFKEVHSDGY